MRKREPSPNLFRGLLALYIVASLGYWVAGALYQWNQHVHWEEHARAPIAFDPDTHILSQVQPEAAGKGLQSGDRLEGLDGSAYTGTAQWSGILAESRPGDTLDIEYVDSSGRHKSCTLSLASDPNSHPNASPVAAFWREFLLIGLLPLICLCIGYWVVLAKPLDRNAWLLLVLLTFPSVLVTQPGVGTGVLFFFKSLWYPALQLAGPPALLLFGVYFPERSRIDVRAPWIKWLVIGALATCLSIIAPAAYLDYYAGGDGPLLTTLGNGASIGANFLNLLCVLLYLLYTLDKLRTASTADARRRLRVLTTGMSVGMGSLLIVFVLLPHFGIGGTHRHDEWLDYTGVLLFMIAPLTLAYVVLVGRAMDVRVILRMGTRYILARVLLWALQVLVVYYLVRALILPVFSKKQPDTFDILGIFFFVAVIFALRMGIRRRLQVWVDRKFFRESYDAETMLHELSEEVRRFTETQPLLETVARRIADTLHVSHIGLMLRRGDSFYLQQAIGVTANGNASLALQSSAVRHLATSNEPARLYRNDPDAWYLMAGTAERQTLDMLNAELLLALPGRNRLMGVMALGPKRSEAAYSKNDLRLLQAVASQTGLALEISELAHSLASEAAQRERVNREMEIAREVQERLFPQDMPDIAGAAVAGSCRPALGVGGDYYDVIELEDGRIGLAVGDVSGKGISAALLMASLRASLRGVALDSPRDFAKLMHKVNRLVYEASASNRYATFFFAAYDPQTRRLECVNAGHNPPLVLRGDQVLRLEAGGPVVGLLPFAPYVEQTMQLEPGDLLLLYTDGISEAMTHDDEEWGEERLIEAARTLQSRPACEILRELFHAADAFTAGAPQHDDMTLLVLRLEGA